jgi:hypothetical protein
MVGTMFTIFNTWHVGVAAFHQLVTNPRDRIHFIFVSIFFLGGPRRSCLNNP